MGERYNNMKPLIKFKRVFFKNKPDAIRYQKAYMGLYGYKPHLFIKRINHKQKQIFLVRRKGFTKI